MDRAQFIVYGGGVAKPLPRPFSVTSWNDDVSGTNEGNAAMDRASDTFSTFMVTEVLCDNFFIHLHSGAFMILRLELRLVGTRRMLLTFLKRLITVDTAEYFGRRADNELLPTRLSLPLQTDDVGGTNEDNIAPDGASPDSPPRLMIEAGNNGVCVLLQLSSFIPAFAVPYCRRR